MQYEVHPAAAIFPLIKEQEFGDLITDIAANGLLEPIVLHNGLVVDGRNRLRACERLNIEPTFVQFDGTDAEIYGFIISKNVRRRHMDKTEAAFLAVQLLKMQAEAQGAARTKKQLVETSQAVKLAPRTTFYAESVVEKGSEALLAAVRKRDIKMHDAAKIAKLSKSEQDKLLEAGQEAIKKFIDRPSRKKRLPPGAPEIRRMLAKFEELPAVQKPTLVVRLFRSLSGADQREVLRAIGPKEVAA